MQIYRNLILVIFISSFNLLQAQDYSSLNFTNIGANNGLPSEVCRFVFQASNGFLWIGTEEGLMRYDGYELINFSDITESDHSNLTFTDATETPDNHLWFSSSQGVYHLNPFNFTFDLIRPGQFEHTRYFSDFFNTITSDNNGNVWFGGNSGLFKYQPNTDSLQHYKVNANKNQNNSYQVKKILFTSRNELWIATWGSGAVRYNKLNDKLEYHGSSSNLNINIINELFEDHKGNLWAARWEKGISVIDVSNPQLPVIIKNFRHYPGSPKKNYIPDNIIHSFANDKYNNIWVGTPYGLVIIEKPYSNKPLFHQKVHHYGMKSISNNIVRNIFMDCMGIMWVSTSGGGVDKIEIHTPQFKTQSIPELAPPKKSQTVHCFTYDKYGRCLIGVQSLGFVIFSPKTNKYHLPMELDGYKKLLGIDINTVKSFLWDNDSNLWIGTRYKGLIKFNIETGNILILNSQTKNQLFMAREIFALKHGINNDIWVATNNGLYNIAKGSSGNFTDIKVKAFLHSSNDGSTLPSSEISDVIIDKGKYLWVSTFQHGIARSTLPVKDYKDIVKFNQYHRSKEPNTGLETDHIITLFKDSNEDLWVGTGGKGIKKWNPESNKFYAPFDQRMLDGYIIYGINESDGNTIWATSNKGLIKLMPDSSGYTTEFFSSRDGLQGNVFIKNAFHKTPNGYFLAGGHKGYNVFNPSYITTDEVMPSVKFTSLNISGNSEPPYQYSKESPLVLSHKDKYVSISFASLDFRSPEKNSYAYKLEGFNEGWQYVDHAARNATYANLKPGRYQFIVNGTNSKGLWGYDPATLHIWVKAAPYATWWAFTFYILFISGLIGLFFSLYIKNIKINQALQLEQIEKEKTEKLTHFKLQFFTNLTHELLTPLSILKILANRWEDMIKSDIAEIGPILNRNVAQLSRLIHQVLQFRKSETGNMKLQVRETNIVALITEIFDNYKLLAKEQNIFYNLNAPLELWGVIDPEKLDIILNNLLSNAFKFTGNGGNISLLVKTAKKDGISRLYVHVKDNGRGISEDKLNNIFERFYQIGYINTKHEGIGIGLALTKNLINMHGGNINVESTPGQGTIFSFNLPISAVFYHENPKNGVQILIDPDKINARKKTENINKTGDPTTSIHKDKTILLVEDNADFRTLLKNDLGRYFISLEAKNAEEALKVAEDAEIDLIISDVMMNGMSGYKLCHTLKNNINTSHIPIILLTAAHEEIERLKGYEAGADSFLTKPIMPEILIKRIEILLDTREERKSKFSSVEFLEPTKISSPSMDEKILEQAKAIVEREINNPDLSVKILRDELGLSNSMLYRKFKILLNLAPNEFIRTIRLRRAAQLLEDNTVNVSEVAYSTGFNDLSYFGVCFKKQFGVTPTTYQKNVKKNDM